MRRLRSAPSRHPGENRAGRHVPRTWLQTAGGSLHPLDGLRSILAGVPAFAGMTILFLTGPLLASEGEKPVARDYSLVRAAAAPRTQEWDLAEAKSAGCVSCHVESDQKTMHMSPAVVLGCVDCHGGNAAIQGEDRKSTRLNSSHG